MAAIQGSVKLIYLRRGNILKRLTNAAVVVLSIFMDLYLISQIVGSR